MIHTISHWKNLHTGNSVYLCGDFHIDFANKALTATQQKELIAAAQTLNAHVIFEGMLDYTGDNEAAQTFAQNYRIGAPIAQLVQLGQAPDTLFDASTIATWQVGIESTPLFHLGMQLDQAGIGHTNIEFRQLHMASFSGHPISYHQVLEYTHELLATIRLFDDTPAHNAFYQERIATFITNNQDLLEQGVLTLKTNLSEPLRQFNQQWVLRCALYSQELLDAFIVHAIYQHMATRETIVVAGSDHIQIVNKALPKLGYDRIATYGGPYWRSADNTKVALCPVDVQSTLTNTAVPQAPKTWFQRLTSLWQ